MKILRLTLRFDGVEWNDPRGFNVWYVYWWNWLPRDARFWGLDYVWYDGPHWMLGLWFTNISWSFPWSKVLPEGRT